MSDVLFLDSGGNRLEEYVYDNYNSAWTQTFIANRHGETGAAIQIFSSSSATDPDRMRLLKQFPSRSEVAAGCAFRVTNTNVVRRTVIQIRDAGTLLVSVNWNTDGTMELRKGDHDAELLYTTPSLIDFNTWGYLALRVIRDGANSYVEFWVEGLLQFVSSVIDLGVGQIDEVAWQARYNSTISTNSRYVAFCDLWISEGAVYDDLRVVTRRPNAAGALSQWDPVPAENANYENVNDVEVDLAKFNRTDVDGNRDSFGIADLPVDAERDKVAGVALKGLGARSDEVAREIAPFVRVGATNFDGTPTPVFSLTFFEHLWVQNPDTVADWTYGQAEAIEPGYAAELGT